MMVLRARSKPHSTDITVRDLSAALLSLLALAAVTLVYARWIDVTNATIVALTFLFIVLITAATSRLRVAVMTSIAAMLSFNFFFLPPVGTWTIADPQNWVALFVFLAVSLVASRLSHVDAVRPRSIFVLQALATARMGTFPNPPVAPPSRTRAAP